jgi:hypothetical protein
MKVIPASARVLDCSPAGERSEPTMNIPTKQQEMAVRSSLRRPTWSTTAEPNGQPSPRNRDERDLPVIAPHMEVILLTKLS